MINVRMNQILTFLANLMILLTCLPQRVLFSWCSRNAGLTQVRVLRKTLKRNQETQFGRTHFFKDITTISHFQVQVALSEYDDYRPFIEMIAEGAENLLTKDKVIMLEPTSGTTSGSKYIPYTGQLQKEFSLGISVWLADLYLHNPGLLTGRAYWSITPVTDKENGLKSKVPVGFEDDAEYLGSIKEKTVFVPFCDSG